MHSHLLPPVVDLLAELLHNSTDHQVRVSAARALRHFYSRRSVTALLDALATRDFGVAYEAGASVRYLTGVEQDMELAAWQEWLDDAFREESNHRPQTDAAEPSSEPERRGES